MQEELKSLSTTTRDLRKFGLMVGGVFLLLGGLALWRHTWTAPWLLTPGILLFGLGLIWPRALKLIYIAWMGLGLGLGSRRRGVRKGGGGERGGGEQADECVGHFGVGMTARAAG